MRSLGLDSRSSPWNCFASDDRRPSPASIPNANSRLPPSSWGSRRGKCSCISMSSPRSYSACSRKSRCCPTRFRNDDELPGVDSLPAPGRFEEFGRHPDLIHLLAPGHPIAWHAIRLVHGASDGVGGAVRRAGSDLVPPWKFGGPPGVKFRHPGGRFGPGRAQEG